MPKYVIAQTIWYEVQADGPTEALDAVQVDDVEPRILDMEYSIVETMNG